MKEDRILLANIEDRIHRCEKSYSPVRSDFLDPHQRSIVESKYYHARYDCGIFFFGGYDDAERVCCLMLPDYGNIDEDHGLALLRVTKCKGSKNLTHRDYLGALMSMGIKREKIGDILTREDGADIVVANETAEYLSSNYDKVGRVEIKTEVLEISQLKVTHGESKELTDTLASLRLDNCVSSAFSISRNKAVEAIKRGVVFLNNKECLKADREVRLEDKIVLRGSGKAKLVEIGGKSRKDRIYVKFNIYK